MKYVNCIVLLGILIFYSSLLADDKIFNLNQCSPEENAIRAVGGKDSANDRYLVVKSYFLQGDLESALRASKKVVELLPKDAKALGMLAYMEARLNLDTGAITHARQAYLMGHEDSLILLSVLLYKQGGSANWLEVASYVPKLNEIKGRNAEAWQPLLMVGIGLAGTEKKAFEEKYLANVDLVGLAKDKTLKPMLIIFYRSLGDTEKLKKIESTPE